MAPGGHRMPPNPHIVGRVEESRIDTSSVADDPPQEFGIPAIATPHPVFSENPDIAWLRSWRCGNRRDDLVIRVDSCRQDHIDLAGREAGQREIDINIDRTEFAEFQ